MKMNKLSVFILSLVGLILLLFIFRKKDNFHYTDYIPSRNPNIQDIISILNVNKKPKNKRTIFVSVASYRDKECPNTIRELFSKASNPSRVYIGICQQNKDVDIDCVLSEYNDRIKIIRLKDTEAKGPTYARYMCSTLYDGEDYFMQIDSHSKMTKDWDKNLIEMCPVKKAVLTCYPNDWDNIEKDKEVSIVCKAKINNDNMIVGESYLQDPCKDLVPVPFVSAGFFFTYGVVLTSVPYDENLPYLFEGEEALYTVRLWTSGWDFFAPNKIILYHYYYRNGEPKYWDRDEEYTKNQIKTKNKVRYLLGLSTEMPEGVSKNKGLGTERSLEDYYNYVGINLENKKTYRDFC